jgi:hypothetical protein
VTGERKRSIIIIPSEGYQAKLDPADYKNCYGFLTKRFA